MEAYCLSSSTLALKLDRSRASLGERCSWIGGFVAPLLTSAGEALWRLPQQRLRKAAAVGADDEVAQGVPVEAGVKGVQRFGQDPLEAAVAVDRTGVGRRVE